MPGHLLCIFTMYHLHYSAAAKLALAPVSIKTIAYFPSNSMLITGVLSFLSFNAAILSCYLFSIVCSSFLTVWLSLKPEDAIWGTKVMNIDLKMIFTPKTEASGFYIELVLGMAILAMAA